ncbi:transcription termination factor 2 isoform X1 [Anopheles aquasalis]|uniref:transcription termination factor 2 isoform X1 n=1 Tax=Anopheles aquasalis TaxID=42839 RepID=UPI00215A7396|nr:transcription termination factor 2 isoform X1 [Anopheles aquasalis]
MSAEDISIYAPESGGEESFSAEKSRTKYHMQGDSIVIDETESEGEEVQESTTLDESEAKEEVEEEEEEEDDESLVRRMKNRQSKRMSLHPRQADENTSSETEQESSNAAISASADLESDLTVEEDQDEEDDERQVEYRAYSPATRRSIHGLQPATSSEDESEEEQERSAATVGNESDNEIVATRRVTKKRLVISSDEEVGNETGADNETASSAHDSSKTEHNSFEASLTMHSFDAAGDGAAPTTKKAAPLHESSPMVSVSGNRISSIPFPGGHRGLPSHGDGDVNDSISMKLSSTLKTDQEDQSEIMPSSVDGRADKVATAVGRPSPNLKEVNAEKMSSSQIQEKFAATPVKDEDKSSSVELIEKSEEILCLSSEDEPVAVVAEQPQPASERRSVPQTLVQPTITAFVRERVSQSEYDANVRKMADLKSQLVLIENVMRTSNRLPDKGAGLVRRMAKIKQQIFELSKAIEITRPTPKKGIKQTIRQQYDQSLENSGNASGNTSEGTSAGTGAGAGAGGAEQGDAKQHHISWDVLKKATDDIQPRFTGKQGITTFENQKLLTLDRLQTLHKSIESCPSEDTLADPPKLLKIDLMNHQRHALAWMLWRESQKPRGGILADDMGLGKTLSMISLILKVAEMDPDGEQLTRTLDSDEENEENESPAAYGGWKAKGRKDYYAGGTLIVCPASLMRQWEGEITNRVKRNSLAVCVHHGTQRDTKPRHIAKYDVVITTYNIVSREVKDLETGGGGCLFGVNWERLILDEAHVIRNHKSAMSDACCKLRGRFRWVLTGTPIQNKEMDVYALMKFLRCSPFDDLQHWKRWVDNKSAGGQARLNTIMKSIMLRRTKKQLQDRGSLKTLPTKTIELIEVTLDTDEMNVYQKVLLYSKTLFAQFLHQRAEKEQEKAYGGGFYGRPTFAGRGATDAFEKVHQRLKRMHNKQEESEVKQFQILVLLLRLRQICCHPGLIHNMLGDDEGNFDISGHSNETSMEDELDLLGQLNKLNLNDVIAEQEAKTQNGDNLSSISLNLSDKLNQPEAVISKASSKVMLKSNPVFNLERISSKIEKLLQLIEEKIIGTDDKAIVVSQWTSVLDIIATHLSARNIAHVSLTGKVPVKLRNDIVLDFNKPSTKSKIMLLSLTAGGVGLNLVGANQLFLLDPHWNPQLEAQAQDRIYRVGQTKPVLIWKFICQETVEQKILALQEHKLQIADGVLTGKGNKGSKLTIDDLKTLFGV